MSDSILPPSFLTYTLGCRVNQAEVTVISKQLTVNSFVPFNKAKHSFPTFVLINTCAVTQKAERESRKAIHHFKRLYPKAKIVCLGCAAKFVKDADLVIKNPQKPNAVKIIFRSFSLTHRECQAKNPQLLITNYLSADKAGQLLSSSGRALVKIQEGCNQFCPYCIVPYLRGKPKSTSPKEIICQINKSVDEGIKEIILCGINLSLYGIDLKMDSSPSARNCGLTALIKKILKETNAERISLSSIEPEYLYRENRGTDPKKGPSLLDQNSEFVELFLNEPRLSKYFHLALQSGSPDTIKNMGRRTDLDKLMDTLHFIKEKCPEFTFRADIIAGFPTETKENFQETLDFIKKAPITFVHSFQFSIRPGIKAERFLKQKIWKDLPPAVKKERAKRLMKLAKIIQKKEAEKLIGKTLPCLIIKKTSGGYEAMAENSWRVVIRTMNNKQRTMGINGKILPVKIAGFKNNFLLGAKFQELF